MYSIIYLSSVSFEPDLNTMSYKRLEGGGGGVIKPKGFSPTFTRKTCSQNTLSSIANIGFDMR